MRSTALLSIAIASALALGIEIARADSELPGVDSVLGNAVPATGYVMPFDPARVALAAPLGPLMAFGPASPDEAKSHPSPANLYEEED